MTKTLSSFLFNENAYVPWCVCIGWQSDARQAVNQEPLEDLFEMATSEQLSQIFGIPIDDEDEPEEVIQRLFDRWMQGWVVAVYISERYDWTESSYSTGGGCHCRYAYVEDITQIETTIRAIVTQEVERMRAKAFPNNENSQEANLETT